MSTIRGLLIFGFGGHARSVADVAFACGVRELCFVDDNARDGECFMGFPVVKQRDGGLPEGWQAFSATGDNERRQQQCKYIQARGWPLATLIAPSATIGIGSLVAVGCLIAQQAHIGPMASVGVGCIVNTGAVVEHECIIGDYSHISVNATVAGRSTTGRLVMVGAGATVIDGVELAGNVTIGAGSVVLHSFGQAGVYVGVPAREVNP